MMYLEQWFSKKLIIVATVESRAAWDQEVPVIMKMPPCDYMYNMLCLRLQDAIFEKRAVVQSTDINAHAQQHRAIWRSSCLTSTTEVLLYCIDKVRTADFFQQPPKYPGSAPTQESYVLCAMPHIKLFSRAKLCC